jgi:hypothetical protein
LSRRSFPGADRLNLAAVASLAIIEFSRRPKGTFATADKKPYEKVKRIKSVELL